MSSPRAELLISCDASRRLDAAREWLSSRPRDAEVLVVAPSLQAGDDLLHAEAASGGTRFGAERLTLFQLATRLAVPSLARAGRVPATGLSGAAVIARAVHGLRLERSLDYFHDVAARPGFPATLARTFEELRREGIGWDSLERLPHGGPDLAVLGRAIERELEGSGLADRALVLEWARAAIEDGATGPPVGLPALLLDVSVTAAAESHLVAALARRAPRILATAPAGDARARAFLERALECEPRFVPARGTSRLAALKTHLFEETAPEQVGDDDTVTLESAPGESHECVEIARRILEESGRGVRFDRMAVLLRSPVEYRSHLEEAFGRASIPVYFAHGTTRPDRPGRALMALLACRAEGLSARRFAEYLSLAQVPDPGSEEERPPRWVPPDHELVPEAARPPATSAPAPLAASRRGRRRSTPASPNQLDIPLEFPAARPAERPEPSSAPEPPPSPVHEGTVRAPWRWERLIVDAAVIGGKERWARRLNGLSRELRVRRAALDDADEARIAQLERLMADLANLTAFALPLIERLAALPERATWGEWLEHLEGLTETALRELEGVLARLAELRPMGPVGPVDLDEVRLVLAPHLRDIGVPPPGHRYGAVFVGPIESARGMGFEVVFVPGLAEKLFPPKLVEDPLLLDEQRRALQNGVITGPDRVAAERLALRLAAGAARERLHLSYPRLDVEQARARVPSFYGLEALRAIEGQVSGFEELQRRSRSPDSPRLGWPAPERPEDAIDEAEYDLAVLAPLRRSRGEPAAGAARYLLAANPHLARALRARALRWSENWTSNDGLLVAEQDDLVRAALERHQMDRRAFSPTALQHFAACPYRFFLQAIQRLEPREESVAIEVIDPLTRGALFHEAQFEILSRLRARRLLPVSRESFAAAREIAEAALGEVAARYEEDLAPAIPRVWQDGVQGIRADLVEWLRRAAEAEDGWIPDRFELSFGIVDRERRTADPSSVPDPVPVEGGLMLRGSIDLVERGSNDALRVTDHKTGKVRVPEGLVVYGGQILQPVLYGLAAERLLGRSVVAGRLYFCTADGGFQERVVALDGTARAATQEVAGIIGAALEAGFLPAAPAEGACKWCDYRPVCGPWEEFRTSRKPGNGLAGLKRLRGME